MVDLAIEARRIRAALSPPEHGGFEAHAAQLLDALGYRSDLTLPGQSGAAGDFLRRFPVERPGAAEGRFREHAVSAHVILQVTDDEVAAASPQRRLMESGAFNGGNARSFIFAAVELRGGDYARGRYADFTREVNRRFNAPVVVLFRNAAGRITLAFPHRRANKRDPNRDVVGSVSLIREIVPDGPHRAHIDILGDLSLDKRIDWMEKQRKPYNFDGLMDAWLYALDTEELNRRFYRELFRWFQRAVATARFPAADGLPTAEEHAIRLITRMLFVWFVKEKGLVAEDLFVESQVAALLKDYDRAEGDSYYRAVLQNLFFATLNTEIGRRGFSEGANVTHRDFTRYRYKAEIADRDGLLALFAQTPFINGGLFDCLDSEEAADAGGVRIDYFTDNVITKGRRDYAKLSIPNRLFFDEDKNEPGLVALFNRYKFTVEENTPAEQEVALDPELLGKVFENLLAAYNPETRESARKQTGSYYTPRPVVDYMVDEALTAAIAAMAAPPGADQARLMERRLRRLFDYNDELDDAAALFDEGETGRVIRAIADLRVLDPAVGSGAFPMGVLHKLTLALRRLDPDNTRWEELQKERARTKSAAAYDIDDQERRDDAQREISALFERYRDSDFGRKLYLIQNSIYGVDVQPVATQIAKLRFFISLAIEQRPDRRRANFGIRPLPNLETRFVAADTLRGLARSPQLTLGQTHAVQRLEAELAANRERHFHAGDRKTKLSLRKEDVRLRKQLSRALQAGGLPAASAESIAAWDPYDQNASAKWFDPEYMFDVKGGFDVVIANPPYAQLQRDGGKLADQYANAGYTTLARTGDLYQLFYERGCQVLNPSGGLLAYITSNSWLKAEYGKTTRKFFSDNHTPLHLLELGKDVFDSAIVDSSVLMLCTGGAATTFPAVDVDRLPADARAIPPDASLWGEVRPGGEAPWSIMSGAEQSVMDKMRAIGVPLGEWDVNINRGIPTGYNDAFVIDTPTRDALISQDSKSTNIIKPILRGRDIQRYRAKWAGLWLIATLPALNIQIDDYPAVKAHLLSFGKNRLGQTGLILKDGTKARKRTRHAWFETQDAVAYYKEFEKEKLLWMQMSGSGRFSYAEPGMHGNQKTFIITGQSLKYLCAILNSTLSTWFMKQGGVTTGMGLIQWDKFSVARLPIPQVSAEEEAPFVALVDRILAAKAADPRADTSALEREIDDLVYALYGLTEAERAAVEAG